MKTLIKTFLTLIFIIFLNSCSEDNSSEATQFSMKAKINGVNWSSLNNAALANLVEFGQNGVALQITGISQDFKNISLSIPMNNLSTGSQTFSGEDANGTLSYSNLQTNELYYSFTSQGNFTVNITEIDIAAGQISGTFSGNLYNDEGMLLTITEGEFNNITLFSSNFYSNGTFSLKRNNGQVFTMDSDASDGKYIVITENSSDNSVAIFGYNSTLTNDFGIYSIKFPKNTTPGTYTITNNGTYSAGLGNSQNEPEYNVTNGILTISSNTANNIVGTFNFTANNGVQTVNISSGSFNISLN